MTVTKQGGATVIHPADDECDTVTALFFVFLCERPALSRKVDWFSFWG